MRRLVGGLVILGCVVAVAITACGSGRRDRVAAEPFVAASGNAVKIRELLGARVVNGGFQ